MSCSNTVLIYCEENDKKNFQAGKWFNIYDVHAELSRYLISEAMRFYTQSPTLQEIIW